MVEMRWYTKIVFASGHFLNVLGWAMWYPYSVTFYTKVLKLPPKTTGNIILVVQISAAVALPFLGAWSDQTRLKYGRRKIFHLLGMVATAGTFFFMWHQCFGCSDAPPAYQALYFSSFGIVFSAGWSAVGLAQLSLIPELALDKNLKVQLNALRNTFTYIASILVVVCFWVLLEKVNSTGTNDITPHDSDIFWEVALGVIILGVLVSAPFQLFVHEDSTVQPPSLKWTKWVQKPEFYLTASVFATSKIVYLIPQTYMPLYFIDTLNMDKASIAKGPLVFFISAFLTTFVVKKTNKSIGEKMTFFIGVATVWGALIWLWVEDRSSDAEHSAHFSLSRDNVYGAIFLLGVGGTIMLTIAMAMISYLVGDYKGSSAFVVGWMAFLDRVSNGVTVKILQQITPDDSSGPFYRYVMISTSFVATGLALVFIALFILLEQWQKKKRTSIQQQLVESTNVQSVN